MRKIGRTNVRRFSEKGWPTRRAFLYNMNTYLICHSAPGGVAFLRYRNPWFRGSAKAIRHGLNISLA